MINRPIIFYIFTFLVFLVYAIDSTATELILESNKNAELQQLLAPFKEIQQVKLSYTEKRFSLFLKKPQVSNGYIQYTRPDQFIKQVLSPDRKTYVIEKEQLTIHTFALQQKNQKNTQTVNLNDYPQFKQLKALFSGLLLARSAELTQFFRYKIHSMSDNTKRLTLQPHINNPFLQEAQSINKRIDIIFRNQHIKKIIMTGFGGERSELEINDSAQTQKMIPKKKPDKQSSEKENVEHSTIEK